LAQFGNNGVLQPLPLTGQSDEVLLGNGTFANVSTFGFLSLNGGTITGNLTVNGTLDATSYTVNGSPLVSSPWTISGSNISYSTGNVGIGGSATANKLDVYGDTRIQGALSVDDELIIGAKLRTSEIESPNGTDPVTVASVLEVNAISAFGTAATVEFYSTIATDEIKATDQSQFLELTSETRMMADACVDGKFGVGTIAPGVKLDVIGDIRSSGTIDAGQYTLNGNPVQFSQWISSGSDIYYDNGNVGIGTDSPNSELEVVGDVDVTGVLKVGSASIFVGGNGPGQPIGGLDNNIYTTNGPLSFQNGSAENTIINPGQGNVGIGTADPQKKCHIKTAHPLLVEDLGDESHSGIRLENITTDNQIPPNTLNTSIWDIEPVFFNGIAKLDIGTPDNPIFTVTDQGRVGIGTTDPGEILNVSGGNILLDHSRFLQADLITDHVNLIGLFNKSGLISVKRVEISEVNPLIDEVRIFTPGGKGTGVSIHDGTDHIAFFRTGGNVGIGTTSPSATLQVAGKTAFAADGVVLSMGILSATGVQIHQATNSPPPTGGQVALIIGDTSARSMLFAPYLGDASYNWLSVDGDLGLIFRNAAGLEGGSGFVIGPQLGAFAGLRITPEGNVGIGTRLELNPNNYMLAVSGTIGAKKVKVEITSDAWSDHVFADDHVLMNWRKKEKIYKKERHLPGIPSADDIGKNGLDIAPVMSGMTFNIEENRMDITALYKRMEKQDKKIEELEKENKLKDKRIKELEKGGQK